MNLAEFDLIVVNSSAGKDSQTMLDVVCRLAAEQGVLARVVVVHANLGRVEWKGTAALAAAQAAHYGVEYFEMSRPQGDLLTHVEARGKWPSSSARYCTSDHKRGQVAKIITRLARERGARRVLNCLGMRADESPSRAKLIELERDERLSTTSREVVRWLPIHSMTTAEVWASIKRSGVPHHPAYDLGMPRLSCCFCIFALKAALIVAGRHNPELLDEYVAVEARIGHGFTKRLRIAEVKAAVEAGEQPGPLQSWAM